MGEWFTETFSRDRSSVKRSREAVLNALEPMIKRSKYPDQLLQNMRDRIDHGYGVSGRQSRRDAMGTENGCMPEPLQGGTVAAISQGHGVRILEGDPAKIKCNHAVLQTSTAIAEASRHPKLQTVLKKLQNFVNTSPDKKQDLSAQPARVSLNPAPLQVNVAATSWTCIKLPELKANESTMAEELLGDVVKKAAQDHSGAVVIEVIPDCVREHDNEKVLGYTDGGLKAQIRAATQLVAQAKKDNKQLVITFACKDTSVLMKMRDLEMIDDAKRIGTKIDIIKS